MRDLIDLRCGPWQTALADVEMVDAVIVDAPYSARTHGGHDAAPTVGRGAKEYERRPINYGGWSAVDVDTFIDSWSPRCRGWFVTITDHILAPAWAAAMERHGRYVFAPLPWFAPGSRVRLVGDGPSSWTCWIVVGRPRTGTYRDGTRAHKWGTLPGGYNVTSEKMSGQHIGGKPSKLMRILVNDYSRPGDLICDPCAGWATTLLAAAQEGRRAVGSEMDPDTYADALKRLDRDTQQADLFSDLRRQEGS
tara:strand:+ start:96 stop:845 length:750 start_codon:yes stop_codon:yes gene_type:complete